VTRKGRLALVLGVVTYLVARLFGARPLYPVAFGLSLAVLAAWLWVRLSEGEIRLRRIAGRGDHVEGDDVDIELRLDVAGPAPAVTAVHEHVTRLGERRTELRRGRGTRVGRYTLAALPRGRYVFEDTRIVLEDPLGFEQRERPVPATTPLLVRPRLVDLDRLFSEAGMHAHDGRRLLLRRPSGFDLHSVREYERGESLRKVHWRSTAKRGELMVKELEDAPRDEVAVLLDADATAVVGESFDVQVRAAGSLLQAQARRGRRALLVVNGLRREQVRVNSADGSGDWRQALDLLAAVEPDGRTPAGVLVGDEAGAVARALDLTVVTAAPAPQLLDRLLQRALSQRRAALVWVDAASFAVGATPTRVPALVRLQAAGVPVAVVRRGDDLAAVLRPPQVEQAAHA
jgi:uncharacterized protein (DUF58 family)